jgi:valyl-tRNA synthetase
MELAKSFEPADIERRWYPIWESRGYFAAGLDSGQTDNFCILLPPPNVTGTLHMGHGFNQAIMDALTRYHRMRGDNTLWQPGTDHAGIATQIVVERQLDGAGCLAPRSRPREVSRKGLGVEGIFGQHHHAPDAPPRHQPDWSRERFTMDAGCRRSSPRPSSASTTKA